MAKISAYGNGGTLQTTDKLVVARSGTNKYILGANISLPPGFLYGCQLSNNVADATNDIDIAAGKCRDSTDVDNLILTSTLTKRLDAAWVVGTNQGGLDTGAIANTTYHTWLIKRSDTGVVDALFSVSASAPTMPANYDYKRRIGSIVRLGGTILAFVQDGDEFTWLSPKPDVSAVTNPGTAAVTRTLTVPVGIRVKALVVTTGEGNTAADMPGAIYISDLSVTNAVPGTGASNIISYTTAAGNTYMASLVMVYTNTSGQVRSRLQLSAAGTRLYMTTLGWIDTRERLG